MERSGEDIPWDRWWGKGFKVEKHKVKFREQSRDWFDWSKQLAARKTTRLEV